jgi:hypothetical protein
MNAILDIIGYWGAVTIICAVCLYWVVVLVPFFLDLWLYRISKKKMDMVIWNKSPKWWRSLVWGGEELSILLVVLSMAAFAVVGLIPTDSTYLATTDIPTSLGYLNYLALRMTPYLSYILTAGIVTFTLDFLGRKGYSLMEKVKELSDKLESNNKESKDD